MIRLSASSSFRFNHRAWAAIALPVMLASCSTFTGTQHTSVPDLPPMPATFTEASGELPSVNWWVSFNDSTLDALVEKALANNYSLKAASARVEQSLASLRGSRSDYYPTVNAELGKSRRWNEDDTTTSQWSGGLTASYELDLWGSIRANARQSEFTADATVAAYRTLANTVAGQMTTSWLGLRMQSENLILLERQRDRLTTALTVIEGRKRSGQAALTDVWQQQKLVESINVDLQSAKAEQAIYLQQINLWSGQADAVVSDDTLNSLTTLPQLPDNQSGVSLEALKARPDVQQAFYQLQAAGAGVAAAVANRYPRFTLSASYTGEDSELSQVFDNWVANLAGSLVLPLIDGAQRRAEVSRQKALEAEAVANYTQTVLEAAQEVQEALVVEDRYVHTAQSLKDQLDLARKTLQLQDMYYARGQIDFLDLLNAQQELLALEKQYLTARWSLIQARIQLYKAVSHGQFGETE
ncbi:MAG: TolC family protein [Alcanivorax sp.]